LELQPEVWNLAMFGTGFAGLLVVWFVPEFLIAFPIFLALYLTPSLAYANLRNQQVPRDKRVLTSRHFKLMARRYLRLNLEVGEEEKEDTGPPVKFIGKSLNEASEDPTRVARARGSKGYKAALRMVYDAIQQRATDIHLEPERNQTAVRFRVDGILQKSDP